MSKFFRHSFHLVDESPWPLISAMGGMLTTLGLVIFFLGGGKLSLTCGLMVIILSMYQWWRDISLESTFQGLHSSFVELGMRWGMIMFIVSEVLFFMSFFWAFFHSSLTPSEMGGSSWPPTGIYPLCWFKVPLLNTLILLSSGISVTWAHHSIMCSNFKNTTKGLAMTIILGVYFSGIQGLEYWESSFSLADGVYGSSFFMATGFHGLHVLVGTVFLLVVIIRHLMCSFSHSHHFGFEAASWYWHFVDVVWLFLFVSIYWWGGSL